MKEFSFTAVSGGDWAELMVGYVDGTSAPLTDLDTGEIQIQVQDSNGGVMLNLTTLDGTITRPASGQFQWVVRTADMSSFSTGQSYFVAARHLNGEGGTTLLWIGTLAYLVGSFTWQ